MGELGQPLSVQAAWRADAFGRFEITAAGSHRRFSGAPRAPQNKMLASVLPTLAVVGRSSAFARFLAVQIAKNEAESLTAPNLSQPAQQRRPLPPPGRVAHVTSDCSAAGHCEERKRPRKVRSAAQGNDAAHADVDAEQAAT